MTYEFVLHRPGVADFERKTGYPIPYPPVTELFTAKTHTEALTIGLEMYERTGLKRAAHFNVGLAS